MLQPDKAEMSLGEDDRLVLIADQNRYLRTIRGMTFGLLLIASVSAIYFARDFLLPVVLAFLLALTLSPIVRYLQRRGIAPAVTSVVLVAGVLGVIAAATFFLATPVSNWLERAPAIGHQISMKVEALRSPVDAVVEASKQVDHLTETTSSPNVQKVVIEQPGLLSRAADNVVGTLTTISITVVLLLFLLSSGTLSTRR
jgi:predicted PurR-regulated permease PerM